jgi:uroporphyrinogen decarboxylase
MKTARMLDVERCTAVAESVFMRACRGETVERTPVWLMRQAGRYQPEFRAVRAAYGFLELCKTPEKACEVTVMAVEMLNVDAAIIFADILLPIDALGLGLEYVKGEGPQIHRPVRSRADVEALPEINVATSLNYVYDAIELTSKKLQKNIPLIGFAGAPFTLASYMIEVLF